jgi:hypothetical protein
MPTTVHDPAKVINSDFTARATGMPAGTALYALVHATVRKFGHNLPLPLQPQINEAAAVTRAASLAESVKKKKERGKRPS